MPDVEALDRTTINAWEDAQGNRDEIRRESLHDRGLLK